jgi:hypothetical protein
MGHFAIDCRAPKRERKSKPQEEKKVYTAKEEKKKEFAFNMKNLDTKAKEIWLLDSGASNHICCMREKFIEIQAIDSSIEVGDGRQLEINEIGTVQLKIKVNNKIHHIKALRLKKALDGLKQAPRNWNKSLQFLQ